MIRHFSYKAYARRFIRPLKTARGEWSVRRGFIVRIEANGRVGYGEVAPIAAFGTESIQAAEAFLERLVASPELAEDADALADLPCCAFGLSAAEADLENGVDAEIAMPIAGLLPAGSAALAVLASEGSRAVYKWKIGVASVAEELSILKGLLELLPSGGRLRLDANGGFSPEDFEAWLQALAPLGRQIEYLEQPLPVGEEAAMAEAMVRTGVTIALDESLNGENCARFLELGAWAGPLVIKPALMGAIPDLRQRLKPVTKQVVFSSVFETAIGRRNVFELMRQLPELSYAIGFDTDAAFADGLIDGDVWTALVRDRPFELKALSRSFIVGVAGPDFRSQVESMISNLEVDYTSAMNRGILLAERDPVKFAAVFFAAVYLKVPVLLANPNWGTKEWVELSQMVDPAKSYGVDFKGGALEKELPEGAILIPTGGSSGGVKLAVHSWGSLSIAVEGLQAFLRTGPINSCCCLPLYHVSGLMQLVRSFVSDGSIRFDDQVVAGACLSWVPTQLSRALDEDEEWLESLRQARAIFVGGAPMSGVLAREAREARLPIVPVYGMTETAAMVAAQSSKVFLSGEGKSIGAAVLPHVKLSIDKPNTYGHGRIRVWSEALFCGYWPEVDLDRSSGYLTDDEGYLDSLGQLHVIGRVDRLLISGGEKVDPREVELALLEIDGVREALVIGEPDAEWGTRVHAYLVADSGLHSEFKLKALLQSKLTAYKLPKQWSFVQRLPLDEKGKRRP